MKSVTILGATGSIGDSTLSVLRAHPDKFQVTGLTAHRNVEKLACLAKEFDVKIVAIADETKYTDLKEALSGSGIGILSGAQGVIDVAAISVDIIMAAILGMAGLNPTLEAIKHGKTVAFASKEALVGAGDLMMAAIEQYQTSFLPVDSEHNAIFQVLDTDKTSVKKIILTASGGPFRTASLDMIAKVTPEQAVAHPNWSMGAKISVDSATLMNKGLELIEAHYLFGMPEEKIDVIIHPQSIIHSMVEYVDGSVLAQLGAPDMCTPITYCLGYPERIETPGKYLDWAEFSNLNFEHPDHIKFPCLNLAREALNIGQGACIALNACNEVAVEAFLHKQIRFNDIVVLNQDVLNDFDMDNPKSIEDVLAIDARSRNLTQEKLNTYNNTVLKA